MKRFSVLSCLTATALIVMSLVAGRPAAAAGLPAPQGAAILTVSGAISTKNVGDSAVFDLAMLQAMPHVTIHTGTPWTGVSDFEGVALSDLLSAVGATGAAITATALNNYAVDLPASDAKLGAIVAYKVDGKLLSVRDKGPLWIIYPFDSDPSLKSEVNYARCIWQLSAMTLK